MVKIMENNTTTKHLGNYNMTNKMKTNKTPVEEFAFSLYEEGLLKGNGDSIQDTLEIYKEYEKQVIIKAAARGYLAMAERFNLEEAKEYGEEYYDNCFGK